MRAMELLDVVDEHNQIIGCMSRNDVHRFALRHRASHVLAFDSRRFLFLQKRSPLKECSPGLWDSSAAGHLMPGEDYQNGAARELEEELGLVVPSLTPILKVAASEDTGWEFVSVFHCQTDTPIVIDPNEIETGDWFSCHDIDRWMLDKPCEFTGTLRLIWRSLRETRLL